MKFSEEIFDQMVQEEKEAGYRSILLEIAFLTSMAVNLEQHICDLLAVPGYFRRNGTLSMFEPDSN